MTENKAIFDQMAARYDTADRAENARIIAGAIRGALSDTGGKAAMDYGCGTGLVGLELVDLFASMLFVDASAEMLKQVDAKIRAMGIANARTLWGDFAQAPPGLRMDFVILSQVLLHVRDYLPLLDNLYDALNAGGHLIIVDFDRNHEIVSDRVHPGFEQAELSGSLKAMGFEIMRCHTFHYGKAMFMNKDASLFILDGRKK